MQTNTASIFQNRKNNEIMPPIKDSFATKVSPRFQALKIIDSIFVNFLRREFLRADPQAKGKMSTVLFKKNILKQVCESNMYHITKYQMRDIIELISQGKDWIEYSRLRYLAKHLMMINESNTLNRTLTHPKVTLKNSNSASIGSSENEIDDENGEDNGKEDSPS